MNNLFFGWAMILIVSVTTAFRLGYALGWKQSKREQENLQALRDSIKRVNDYIRDAKRRGK